MFPKLFQTCLNCFWSIRMFTIEQHVNCFETVKNNITSRKSLKFNQCANILENMLTKEKSWTDSKLEPLSPSSKRKSYPLLVSTSEDCMKNDEERENRMFTYDMCNISVLNYSRLRRRRENLRLSSDVSKHSIWTGDPIWAVNGQILKHCVEQ